MVEKPKNNKNTVDLALIVLLGVLILVLYRLPADKWVSFIKTVGIAVVLVFVPVVNAIRGRKYRENIKKSIKKLIDFLKQLI